MQSAASRPTVLCVDADEAMLEVTREHLRTRGFRTRGASGGQEAMRLLGSKRVDCILSGYSMPGMDGLELLQRVRKRHAGLPFLLSIGRGSEEIAGEAIRRGVTDSVRTPQEPEDLLVLGNRVSNAVQHHLCRRELRERERRLETLLINLPGVVYRCRNEPGWPMEHLEGACEQLTGYAGEVFENQEVSLGRDVTHPGDRKRVWEEVQEAVQAREPFELRYRIQPGDGGTKWVWHRGRGIEGYDGQVRLLEGFITDVPASKVEEHALEEQRKRVDAAMAGAPMVLFALDREGVFTLSTGRALGKLGLEPGEIVGQNVRDVYPDRPEILANVDRVLEGQTVETRLEVDGLWFQVRYEPVVDDDRRVLGAVGVAIDVTDRVKAEQEAGRERRRALALFEESPDPILEADFQEETPYVARVNVAFEDVFGFPEATVRGRPVAEVLVPEERKDAHEQLARRVARGEEVQREVRRETRNGVRDFVLRVIPIEDPEEGQRAYAWYTDVTERRRRERELERQNERLGEFANLVSHDLRNPLRTAFLALRQASRTKDPGSLDTIEDCLERMRTIIEDTLTLARQGETVVQTEPVDVSRLAGECWDQIHAPQASVSIAPDIRLQADADRLRQVLENLLQNAVEHAGATVHIRVGRIPGGFFVEDDGVGIPEDLRDEVFESGFSTRSDGTGFGLRIVREIVEAHGWRIDLLEGPGRGARFDISTHPGMR